MFGKCQFIQLNTLVKSQTHVHARHPPLFNHVILPSSLMSSSGLTRGPRKIKLYQRVTGSSGQAGG